MRPHGMASLTDNPDQLRKEFKYMKYLLDDAGDEMKQPTFKSLSMGMSSDYKIAVQEGSTMVRIGSCCLASGRRSEFF